MGEPVFDIHPTRRNISHSDGNPAHPIGPTGNNTDIFPEVLGDKINKRMRIQVRE